MSSHKIEFVKSEAWSDFYTIMIDGGKYGIIVFNQPLGKDGVVTTLWLHGFGESENDLSIRSKVTDTKSYFRMAKSYISFCLNIGAVDLSKPDEE